MSRDFYMVPICVKTTGVWGPSGYKFIKELGRLTSERTKEKRSTSFIMQNISMEIQRGNCASVLCIHSQPKTFKWALWALQSKGPWLAQQLFIYSSYLIFLTKTVPQHKSSINIISPPQKRKKNYQSKLKILPILFYGGIVGNQEEYFGEILRIMNFISDQWSKLYFILNAQPEI